MFAITDHHACPSQRTLAAGQEEMKTTTEKCTLFQVRSLAIHTWDKNVSASLQSPGHATSKYDRTLEEDERKRLITRKKEVEDYEMAGFKTKERIVFLR